MLVAIIVLCTMILCVPTKVNAMARRSVLDILQSVAQATGVPFDVFRTFGTIESSLNPRARTGSYKGLFQLSSGEFNRYSNGGDIYNPEDNAYAFAGLVKQNAQYFKQETGRDPDTFDLYMMHQQGRAGYMEHLANPDQPAWQSMYATGEGQQKGESWARRAIWGNLPSSAKRVYGNVNNVTSQDFLNAWKARIVRLNGGDDSQFASAAPTPSQRPVNPSQRVTFPSERPTTPEQAPSVPASRLATLGSSYAFAGTGLPEDSGAKFDTKRVAANTPPPMPSPGQRVDLPSRAPTPPQGATQQFAMAPTPRYDNTPPLPTPGNPTVGGGGPATVPMPSPVPSGNRFASFTPVDVGGLSWPGGSSTLSWNGGAPPGPVPTFASFFHGIFGGL
jgi:hypothetical protein